MAVSEAQQRAINKYLRNNLDDIKVRVKKGYKDELKAIAAEEGYSLNAFICEAIDEKVEKIKKAKE